MVELTRFVMLIASQLSLIGLRRLQAVLWARQCLDCQERFDHLQRQAAMVELYRGSAHQG